MRAASRFDALLAFVFACVAALFLVKLGGASTASFDLLGDRGRVIVGSATKLASFVCGALFAVRTARSFDGPMRVAWSLAAVWMATWCIAQSYLAAHQLSGASSPFPSPADALFVVGYAAMLAAFVTIVRAYAATGLVGAPSTHVVAAGVVFVPFALLGVVVLRPVIAAGGAPLELALNVGYPALDLAALVPAALLARIAWQMRGGALVWVWALMSLGLAFMVAGDLLYGWFSALGYSALDPLLDVAYVAAYVLVARAIYQQKRVNVVRG